MDPDHETPAPVDEVLQLAGGAWIASLNRLDASDGRVVMQQVDEYVYNVGDSGFQMARHDLADWLTKTDRPEPPLIDCFNAEGALEMLMHLRQNCLAWQCGACDAWIFTTNRPRVGLLQCASCGDGGVDFRHADRSSGEDG